MERRQVTDEEIQSALEDLPGWQLVEGRLHKTYRFPTFARAIGWMVSAAVFADKLDHHPDWCNTYNRVRVELMTHDLGAVSTLDLELARKMEELAH